MGDYHRGGLVLKTSLFLFDGNDAPPQRLTLYLLGTACDKLLPASHSYVGSSAVTSSAFYGEAIGIFPRLRALPASLDARAPHPMRLVETCNLDAVSLHLQKAPPQYSCTAIAPESFPVQLRYFQWGCGCGWNILLTMDRVQLRRIFCPSACLK